ncbi:MAG: glycoside-pentoside-hexuronide (GPH):cation symporter [Bacillota bacterium]|nr:glycoside-pentoside-hexuronide (GPH):cation symporter [Bacillota bacterium]
MAKSVPLDANGYPQFGLRDKIAYAAGDFGCNMSFALKSYLTIFWTQYMGIDSYLMASLLLIVQVWDAINDPVIGGLVDADKRRYKRNKFLVYISVGSCGLLVAGACCFLPFRGMPSMVKNILFVAGYIIWDAFYTIANVPYGSVMSLITTDPAERAELSTWRSAGALLAALPIMMLLPVFVYDADNNLKGGIIFWIALLLGGIGFLAFQFMIRNTTIRVDTSINLKEEQPKFNPVKAVANFARNRAAIGVACLSVCEIIGLYGVMSASQIMFQSYFKNAKISGLLSVIAWLGMFIYMPFIDKIVKRFGKKEPILAGFCLTATAYALMTFLPMTPDRNGLIFYTVCALLATLGNGLYSCMVWSLVADAIDYNEWKHGVRDEGTTYALYSFFRKLAQGIGPSLGLVVATMLGYDASLGAAQSPETALRMRYLVTGGLLVTAICQIISVGVIYNLDRKTLARISEDLKQRREQGAGA